MSGMVYYKVETYKNFNSLIKPTTLVEFTQKRGISAVGIADTQAMYSVMDFYHESVSKSVNPIIGLQMKVHGRTQEESLSVTFVAENYEGYIELVSMLNFVNTAQEKTDGEVKGSKKTVVKNKKKSIHFKDISEMKHVIATVSFHSVMEQNRVVYVEALLNQLKKKVKDGNLWLELEPAFEIKHKEVQKQIAQYANKHDLSIIAAPTIRYFQKEDAKIMSVLVGNDKKKKKSNKGNNVTSYFLSDEEEEKGFSSYPEAIKQTHVLAERCKVRMPLKGTADFERRMPEFQVPEDFKMPMRVLDMFDRDDSFGMPKELLKQKQIGYLCAMAWKGFLADYKESEENEKAKQLLKKELGFIIKYDKTNYFLHVTDMIQYAKKNKIPVGPGRGSVVGSVLAKCLGIIDIDPIQFVLLFERFMNEIRIHEDEADVDIDVSGRDRHRILQYIRTVYGIYHVAKVVTFNPYGGKRAFELVATYYELPKTILNSIKEKIDKRVEDVIGNKSFIAEIEKKQENIMEILAIATSLQNMPNSKSIHAAAIVLSKGDLRYELPIDMVYDQELNTTVPVIQYTEDKKHLEILGYTKIDLLSLPTLDVIEDTKGFIENRTGKPVPNMSYEDEQVYQMFQSGELLGVFQLSSPKMRETSVLTNPTTFRDIINLSALYRPGGKDEIPHYVNNKKKKNRIIYDVNGVPIDGVEELENILHRTYGIIIYQEQIMKIAQVWSGYELGEADILRRAISKKKKQVLENERQTFVQRALRNGRDEDKSHKIYDLIVKFADYGFNESHAVAYAHISYEMAFLKTYFPLEYMSALISSVMDKKVKAASYVKEAKRMGLKVLNPSVDSSRERFEPIDDAIAFGLPMIKDVSIVAIEKMVKERQKRKFLSFTDFLNRMHSLDMNKKILKALISVGTFDKFGNQPQLLKLLDEKTEPLKIPKSQMLFTDLTAIPYDLVEKLPPNEPWTIEEKIQMQQEYAGLVLESTPMENRTEVYKQLLKRMNKTKKVFGGVIVGKRVIKDNKNREMAFLQIQGASGEAKLVVFADVYEKVKQELEYYRYILFQAKKDTSRNQFILSQAECVNEIRVLIHYPIENAKKSKEEQAEWMNSLQRILDKHHGSEELVLSHQTRKKHYQVNICDNLLKDLKEVIKEEAIALEKVR